MPPASAVPVDILIIGGGIAGLWTLDALDRAGFSAVLVEADALGRDQTLASQGIIHGGLKYTLKGLLNRSAEAIAAMPERWSASLDGRRPPDLGSVRVASDCTWLWRSERLSSRLAMVGARIGLRSTPEEVAADDRPAALLKAPGTVYRVAEPVIDTVTLVEAFRDRHIGRLVRGRVRAVERSDGRWHVRCDGEEVAPIAARALVLCAGGGNDGLRAQVGLDTPLMQRRPLHMTLVRGDLPDLHGHCVDGATTRVTVTTHRSAGGHRVWQVGGQLAEDGVRLDGAALVARARDELRQVLPLVDLDAAEWSTYRIDRAERASGGSRPDDAQCDVEGACLTIWPTKLALAPRAADLALDALARLDVPRSGATSIDAPRPAVGAPPWESVAWRASGGAAR